VQQTNIWRYEVVLAQGGIYSDCDVEPLRNVEPVVVECDAFVATLWRLSRQGTCYSAALFGAMPDHAWMRETVEGLGGKDPKVTFSMGDLYLTETVRKHPEVLCCPREVFTARWDFDDDRMRNGNVPEGCYAVHRWSSRWFPAGYAPRA
jgi:mannosyltransferase OCH1-like enzyme